METTGRVLDYNFNMTILLLIDDIHLRYLSRGTFAKQRLSTLKISDKGLETLIKKFWFSIFDWLLHTKISVP